MEAKVNKMLDQADAMAELNKSEKTDNIDQLTSKYDETGKSSEVDDELAALKSQLGM